MSIAGELDQRHQRLKNRLIQEFVYKSINKALDHAEKGNEMSYVLMTECVPCILHLENRTGLKILSILLHAGLESIKEKTIYKEIATVNVRRQKFISDLEDVFNRRIFGKEDRLSNYHLPYNVKEKKFDDITLDNNRTRLVMQNFDAIINICCSTNDRKLQWMNIVSKYNAMMKCLRSKEDFTNDDVERFQLRVDCFYQDYMKVVGRPGITNYFHMLGSGHVSEYLLHYKNLYVHSQQGWEHFNSYLKVFFFRRTSRGGGRGDYNRVRQIARWLGRRLVWLSGTSYHQMNDVISNFESIPEGSTYELELTSDDDGSEGDQVNTDDDDDDDSVTADTCSPEVPCRNLNVNGYDEKAIDSFVI